MTGAPDPPPTSGAPPPGAAPPGPPSPPPAPDATVPAPPARAPARTPRPLPPRLERLGSRHPLVIALLIVTVTVALATTAVTAAGFLADRWWVLDILTSFRPQEAAILAIAAAVLGALRCWKTLAVALVALGMAAWQVAPVYTHDQAAAAPGSPRVTIAHLNLQSGTGDVAGTIDWLGTHPADVVVVLDTARSLPDAVRGGAAGYRMIYPRVVDPGRGSGPASGSGQGTTSTSRPGKKAGKANRSAPGAPTYDPRSAEVVVLTARDDVTASTPTDPRLPDSSVELQLHLGDQTVHLLGLHTQSPTTRDRHEVRDRQLAAVTEWLREAPAPAIAFGDFNVTYYSPELRRVLDRAGARSSQLGFGVQSTWPVQWRPAGIGIDQSIYTGGVTAVARKRGPSLGSEHRVLLVTYALAA